MREIRPLTSVRFIFASLVVAFHGSELLERAGLARDGAFSNLLYFGFIGVPFFFVLSGFVLAYTYREMQTRQSRRDFWLARFARIYPMYLLGLIPPRRCRGTCRGGPFPSRRFSTWSSRCCCRG